jgi:4'-phosphopantetheinyl transferase
LKLQSHGSRLLDELQLDEVRVWQLDLCTWRRGGESVLEQVLERCHAALSVAERLRCGRLRAEVPRCEFLLGRGSLRMLLGPVEIAETAYGKPFAVDSPVRFNVAHSRGAVLIAASRSHEVGVDLESLDGSIVVEDIARDALHDEDAARLSAIEDEQAKRQEFFRCWTAREAVLKCDGRGLRVSRDEFAVGKEGRSDARVALGRHTFFVKPLELGPHYRAAVAANVTRTGMCSPRVMVEEITPRHPGWFAV